MNHTVLNDVSRTTIRAVRKRGGDDKDDARFDGYTLAYPYNFRATRNSNQLENYLMIYPALQHIK